MSKIYYSQNVAGISMIRDGRHASVAAGHPQYAAILVALKSQSWETVEQLLSGTAQRINKFGLSRRLKGRKIYVEGGEIRYIDAHGASKKLDDGPLHERIMQALSSTEPRFADGLLAFLDNLAKNRKPDIRQEIYEWLLSGKTPFTNDGCFLAYKKVRSDFKDIYTGTMDNSPGTIVRMKQADVDPDRHNECSHGLHFCSLGYLSHYGSTYGNRVVIVKVNPRHVFAIPTDYSFQKGRASEYYVVGEYTGDHTVDAFKDSFIDEDTKATVAPEVSFTGFLRPSIAKIAESFGLSVGGKVLVGERRGNPVVVMKTKNGYIDVIGTPVTGEIIERSIETKSVRRLVKAALQKADKHLLSVL